MNMIMSHEFEGLIIDMSVSEHNQLSSEERSTSPDISLLLMIPMH